MNSKILLASLKAQDSNLNQLLSSLEQQKTAIINNDFTTLESAINDEQKFLRLVEKEESNRLKIISDIIKQNSLQVNNHSLAELLNKSGKLFEADSKEIQSLRKSLKEKAEKIKRLNLQLKEVIEFSRTLIKETMMLIAAKNKNALVNKRV
ncbi:MAG: flagellar export chaperone FlgN [Ignavibacteriales bacterium]|nr:flagellar export chaperone FlgN [Ignavibacteriales bacterium]